MVIGQKGENLRGIATRVAFGERVVAVSQGVEIGGAVSPTGDAKARAQAKQDRQVWWKENCKGNCTLLQGVAAKQKQAFDWSQCYVGCLADEPR